MSKTFYITTPIYYTSGNLHIGHAYTTVVCDAIARYKKMRGYDVFYLTGTDEHGQKVQQKALQANKTPKQFVDELVNGIKELWSNLKIDYNHFIRTTDDYHVETVQKVFSKLIEQGDIYKGVYEGWYCTPCEAFFTESQLDENHNCPDCGRPVHKAQEDAYFFKMSKYADKLIKYYEEHPEFVEPESRKNEMINSFLKPGLEDLCVSRTSFDWGVKVKEDPKHVVYVWIDALTNYISALGYTQENDDLFKKFWHNDENHEILHIVGKEIVRFHVIYWPIILLALDLPLPTKIFAHGWIIMKDGKMGKSKGNVVEPNVLINRYGLDALRYYLTNAIPLGNDGLFTPELFIEKVNTDLANNLGNLLSRTVSMVIKYFDGVVPTYNGTLNEIDENLEKDAKKFINRYEEHFDKYEVDEASSAVFDYLSRANKYIDESQPWVLAKDESKREELASVMTHLVLALYQSAIMLQPFLVETPSKIFEQLGASTPNYEDLRNLNAVDGLNVVKGTPLFPRLEIEKEIEYIQSNMPSK